jgi:hypothetical protein
MNDHINKVFVDGVYRYGGLPRKDLAATKRDFYKNALQVLRNTGADHVVYCYIAYSENGEITGADFYSDLPMDDATFHERTAGIPGTDYIGAVHRH